MMEKEIKKLIEQILSSLELKPVDFNVLPSDAPAHGDYSSNVALIIAKKVSQPANKIAEQIVGQIFKVSPLDPPKARPWLGKVEVAVPGFINFYLTPEFFADRIREIIKQKDNYGRGTSRRGQKVLIEYTDPNPFKEFHIGHLMSNAIGESISRLIEFSGAEVGRANYQGDVGLHVAKAIFGLQQMGDDPLSIGKLGLAYALGTERYEESPEAKKEIDVLNKVIYEQSDNNVQALYEEGRKLSLERFEKLYKLLGTKFDHSFFESQAWKRGIRIVAEHPDVFEKSQGAVVFRGEHTRVFITSQGLPTYEAKDLGLLELKKEAGDFDESITITASEQNDYFRVVLEAARKITRLADIARKTKHISHGLMRFAGGKMSSRRGNIVTGASLLGDLTIAALQKMRERDLPDAKKIAEQVAVGAIKYQVLKQNIGKDIIFDPKRSLSFEGNSGPYLQYTLIRARAVLAKASAVGLSAEFGAERDLPGALERQLVHFGAVTARAAREFAPQHLVTYLTTLSACFNNFYADARIINSDSKASYRFALTQATAIILANGLNLLAIPIPERM